MHQILDQSFVNNRRCDLKFVHFDSRVVFDAVRKTRNQIMETMHLHARKKERQVTMPNMAYAANADAIW